MDTTKQNRIELTESTTLLELVATVSEYSANDAETIYIVQHMLDTEQVWYEGEEPIFELH